MTYTIFLRDKNQIQITENDYNNISQFLGKLKLFKLEDGQIVNAVDISRIGPVSEQQVISKEYQISEPKKEEERIKVPGGLQKLSVRKAMIRLFDKMKSQGHFERFGSYFDWEKRGTQ